MHHGHQFPVENGDLSSGPIFRYRMAAVRLILAAFHLDMGLKAGFRPDQPRVPAGQPDGGQRTDEGGGFSRIADRAKPGGFPVDLLEEERLGGHTIATHVGRSPDSLLARVRGEEFRGFIFSFIRQRDGSFPSLMAATKLVNSTLARNAAIVGKVADGLLADAFVTSVFSSPTGIEAFRSSPFAAPRLRTTHGVGVYIIHDRSVLKGYFVVTAYPRND